jgi:hypothetical protein
MIERAHRAKARKLEDAPPVFDLGERPRQRVAQSDFQGFDLAFGEMLTHAQNHLIAIVPSRPNCDLGRRCLQS